MKQLIIHNEILSPAERQQLVQLCPFGAIENGEQGMAINAACKMCGLCTKQMPGAVELIETPEPVLDKAAWRGIAVFAEVRGGGIHPVSLELLGKARELATAIGHPVQALLIGHDVGQCAQSLLRYGADEVHLYDDSAFARFTAERYAEAASDFIRNVRPCALLFGATPAGRSLAPRVAARFRTGLTADCTQLEMRPSTDLVQIRPAFGGNIMAQIITANARPQLCTVRYRVFDPPAAAENPAGSITKRSIALSPPRVQVLEETPLTAQQDISEAEWIVAAGRGIKSLKELELVREFAERIGAQLACTRPLVEAGWMDARQQIGLSGRTVKPKLIICAGISGSVQFAAGMKGAAQIVAINTEREAPIFNIAHLGLVGDVFEILPRVMDALRTAEKEGCE